MIRPSVVLLCAALGAHNAPAQAPLRQGVIAYTVTVNLRKQVPEKYAAMAAMLPENVQLAVDVPFRGDRFAILTRSAAAGQPGMKVQVDGGGKRDLVDLTAGRQRNETVVNGRTYYTEPAPRRAAIAVAPGTRTIAGYACKKALVTTGDGDRYTVWYTPVLPHAYSPEGLKLAGLPGAVLEYSNEQFTGTAVRIGAAGFSEASLQPNAKARKVTQEQLDDLQEDAATPTGGKALILKP